MYKFLSIILYVLLACFCYSVFVLMYKEGLTLSDSVLVVMCAYSRLTQAYMGGRWNANLDLLTTQCRSDTI